MHAAMFSYTLCCLLAYLDICKSTYMKGIDSCMFSWWLIHHKSLQLETWIQDGNHEWSFVTKKRPPFLVVSTNPPKKKNAHNPSKHQVSLKLIGNLRRISKILLKVQVSNRHSECESIWDILSFKSSLINSWLTPPTKKKKRKNLEISSRGTQGWKFSFETVFGFFCCFKKGCWA